MCSLFPRVDGGRVVISEDVWRDIKAPISLTRKLKQGKCVKKWSDPSCVGSELKFLCLGGVSCAFSSPLCLVSSSCRPRLVLVSYSSCSRPRLVLVVVICWLRALSSSRFKIYGLVEVLKVYFLSFCHRRERVREIKVDLGYVLEKWFRVWVILLYFLWCVFCLLTLSCNLPVYFPYLSISLSFLLSLYLSFLLIFHQVQIFIFLSVTSVSLYSLYLLLSYICLFIFLYFNICFEDLFFSYISNRHCSCMYCDIFAIDISFFFPPSVDFFLLLRLCHLNALSPLATRYVVLSLCNVFASPHSSHLFRVRIYFCFLSQQSL